MKKILMAVLLVSLLAATFLFGACAEETAPAPATAPTAEPASEPAPAGPVELKFAYWVPPPAPISRLGFESWGSAIEDATDGLVTVTYFGGAQLGEPADHYDLVVSGTADIAVMTPEFTPGAFPMVEIANLPALFPNSEVAAAALWEYHQKYTVDSDFKDIKLLAVSPTAPNQLHMKTKQVQTLEDLKGMKLACTSVSHAKTIEALGAVPVNMVEGEVFTALERGMVDGRLHAWDSIVTHKTMEVTKYRTGNVNAPLNQMDIIMNKDTWNSLPDEVKGIMTGLTGLNMSRVQGIIYDRANMQLLEVAKGYDKAQGNPDVYWLPEDEMARWEAAMSVYPQEWAADMEAKGLPGNAALSDLRAFVEKYEKIYQ